jgi:uncharacterized RDD family membrane protein YckC
METVISKKTSHLFVRVVAAIIDSILVGVLWYYFIEIWGHPDTRASLTSATVGGDKVVSGTPAMVLMFLTASYWMIPEWLFGATLGKLMFGLRVRTFAGLPISFGQSFKRNLLRSVDFFPFYLTGFLAAKLTPNHQRLGDLWAQTVVVNRKDDINSRASEKAS